MTEPFLSFLTSTDRQARTRDGELRFETTTLLPGGGLISVTLRPDADGYRVSDGGAGRAALLALGVQDLGRGDARRGHDLAEAYGLAFDGEGFSLSSVSADQATAAVAYVAEACRAWCAGALEARARRTERDVAERTVERLRRLSPGVQLDTDRELLGASTKRHRFDIVATLPKDRLAVFEIVSTAPVSIASTHMKFYDLMQVNPDWPREAVADDLSLWPAADIAVVQQVASHVRGLDRAWTDLDRLFA